MYTFSVINPQTEAPFAVDVGSDKTGDTISATLVVTPPVAVFIKNILDAYCTGEYVYQRHVEYEFSTSGVEIVKTLEKNFLLDDKEDTPCKGTLTVGGRSIDIIDKMVVDIPERSVLKEALTFLSTWMGYATTQISFDDPVCVEVRKTAG